MANEDLLALTGINDKSNGGTESIMRRIFDRVPRELLEQTQIIPTRLAVGLDETKIRIAYVHDLPGDPSLDYLKNGGWTKFHKIVFVSNWQMQAFISAYKIPWSKCVVIQNGIEPIEDHIKSADTIRLIYTPTPHRGLDILASVFNELSKEFDNIELDVFSSFGLYGWEGRDEQFKGLFEFLNNHPKINYHGTKSNDEVRAALMQSHIFAYPSTWQETSCLCLIEAMSAGLLCVHSNLAALYETAVNLTMMYQFNEDQQKHAGILHNALRGAIVHLRTDGVQQTLGVQKQYVKSFYNINAKAKHWEALISSLLNEPRKIEPAGVTFDTRGSLPSFLQSK